MSTTYPEKPYIGLKYTDKYNRVITIIAVKDNTIDVKFDDGTIVRDQKYYRLLSDRIINHNLPGRNARYSDAKKQHIGEENIANNGMWMKIVQYTDNKHIRVRFSDAYEVDTQYSYFRRGLVRNPNAKPWHTSLPEIALLFYLRQIGFAKHPMGYWQKFNPKFGLLELDLWNEELMCGIEYDGWWHIKEDATKRDVKKIEACNQSNIFLLHIRPDELPLLPNTITYHKTNDWAHIADLIPVILHILNEKFHTNFNIDVNIERDRVQIIQLASQYSLYAQARIGKSVLMKCGRMGTVIAYSNVQNIIVQFDDGTEVTTTNYQQFCAGNVPHPHFPKLPAEEYQALCELQEMQDYLPFNPHADSHNPQSTQHFHDGTVGTFVQRLENGNVLVNLNDESICETTSLSWHRQHKPSFKHADIKPQRINFRRQSNSGYWYTVIDYINKENCTIKFDNGVIRTGLRWQSVKNGSVKCTSPSPRNATTIA